VDDVAAALDRGEAMLIFPEGHLTRSGHMLPFGSELDGILQRGKASVPVIPACTDGLWGSVFSYRDERIVWKWPRGFRRHVAVMFGEALLPSPRWGEGGGTSPPGERSSPQNPSPP